MFVEQLACMLSVSPSEDLIKDRIRQLQGLTKDGQTVRIVKAIPTQTGHEISSWVYVHGVYLLSRL